MAASNSPAEQLITENIDIWTSAIKKRGSQGRGSSKKIELYGIKKLRELILELAVRGLLVPQDPNDESASVLLEKIAAEKEQLIKDGKIKKQKALLEISEDEKPFELPNGWAWARLGDIGLIASSRRVQKKDWVTEGIPFYRAREIVKLSKDGKVKNDLFITNEMYSELSKKGEVPEYNDIMITGVGTIGVPYKVRCDDKFYFKDASVLIFKNYFSITPDYLCLFMKTPYWKNTIHSSSMGTTVHTLTISRANDVLIPVIPLTEVQSIVAKVDELMALCDQLEQQTESSLSAHQTLVETLLNTLLNADQNSFDQAWERIAQHFDVLFTTEHSIDQLKQTILQLAVMGKLVPQDPSDEPASVLLEKIAAEKEQLIKDGKIKKQKALPEISEDEKPFELPKGWEWVRLEALSHLITKGSSPKWQGVAYTENSEDILFVTSENVGTNCLLLDKKKYVEKHFNDVEPRSVLRKGDILMNIVGGSIGRTAVFDIDALANINQAVCLIRVFDEIIEKEYLLKFFNSETCRGYMFDKQVDNARANLSMGNISKFVIPLPPSTESPRIVEKVNGLLALCETLKNYLRESQTTQLHLADAMAEQTLNS